MSILISTYKGFKIFFNPNSERFESILTEDMSKESASFKAIKKQIDDYVKTNYQFKPFYIITSPTKTYSEVTEYKVIGINSYKHYIVEDSSKNVSTLSNYNLDEYVLKIDSNSPFHEELKAIRNEERIYINNVKSKIKEIVSKMNVQLVPHPKDLTL